MQIALGLILVLCVRIPLVLISFGLNRLNPLFKAPLFHSTTLQGRHELKVICTEEVWMVTLKTLRVIYEQASF